MAIASGQVATNTSTATLIVPAVNANTVYAGHGTQPRSVQILNIDGTNDVYLGTSTVTSGTGYKLLHGASINLVLGAADAIYGISSASTPIVHYIESGA